MSKKGRFLFATVYLCGVLLVGGLACAPPSGGGSVNPDPTPGDDYLPDPATWVIESDGQPQTLVEGTIPLTGGTITTDSGFGIEAPEGALPDDTDFIVRTEAVVSNDFPEGAEVVTPLYDIDNGGEMADDFLIVSIPMEIGEDDFPVVLTWDPDTGQAEVLPLYGYDGSIAKVVTRHFSVYVGIRFPVAYLQNLNYETNFRAGHDDWQFGNFTSWASTNGVCMGMTTSSLWYFDTQKEENLRDLRAQYQYGQYGYNKEETPDFTWDDDVGRRLVSMVQMDGRDEAWYWYYHNNPVKVGGRLLTEAELMHLEVASAFVFEQAPQYLAVDSVDKTKPHAITCTGIDGYTLHCVDPNYEGQSKSLVLDEEDHDWIPYDNAVEAVQHVAKSSTATWEIMPQFWSEMEVGDIGNDTFPDIYYIVSLHDPDTDEIVISSEVGFVSVNEVDTPKVSFYAVPEDMVDYTVYRLVDGAVEEVYSRYNTDGSFNTNPMSSVTLTANEVETYGLLVKEPLANKKRAFFGYIDFKWFTVEYVPDDEPTPTPGELVIPDPCLEHALTEALAGQGLDLTSENLATLGALTLYSKGISDLTGIEHCVNLTWLDMAYNNVSDASPLAGLTGMETLRVDGNKISDASFLANLTNLTFLRIQHQQGDILESLSGIESLVNLDTLYADGNAIDSLEPLASLTSLKQVTLANNAISDLSPLSGLANLTKATLSANYITDIGPMVQSPSLDGLKLNVYCTYVNPNCDQAEGDTTQCDYATTMEAAGATVTLPDPDRECTPGPDGDDFEVPECAL